MVTSRPFNRDKTGLLMKAHSTRNRVTDSLEVPSSYLPADFNFSKGTLPIGQLVQSL